jgi:hypothetical protein
MNFKCIIKKCEISHFVLLGLYKKRIPKTNCTKHALLCLKMIQTYFAAKIHIRNIPNVMGYSETCDLTELNKKSPDDHLMQNIIRSKNISLFLVVVK